MPLPLCKLVCQMRSFCLHSTGELQHGGSTACVVVGLRLLVPFEEAFEIVADIMLCMAVAALLASAGACLTQLLAALTMKSILQVLHTPLQQGSMVSCVLHLNTFLSWCLGNI